MAASQALTSSARSMFSPSDLTEWLACTHAAALNLRVKRGGLPRPEEVDANAALIHKKGLEHEARYLQTLREAGRTIIAVEFDTDHDWERATRETADAIRSGVDVVYQ